MLTLSATERKELLWAASHVLRLSIAFKTLNLTHFLLVFFCLTSASYILRTQMGMIVPKHHMFTSCVPGSQSGWVRATLYYENVMINMSWLLPMITHKNSNTSLLPSTNSFFLLITKHYLQWHAFTMFPEPTKKGHVPIPEAIARALDVFTALSEKALEKGPMIYVDRIHGSLIISYMVFVQSPLVPMQIIVWPFLVGSGNSVNTCHC